MAVWLPEVPPYNVVTVMFHTRTHTHTGSGPATPGTAHTAQTHSSLDTERRQSMATALNEVLANMSRRSFPLSPTSPPPLVNGDLNKTLTPDKNKTLSPVDRTPQGRGVVDLDTTLTPFDSSPQFRMSPINATASPLTGTFGPSPRGKVPSSKRRFSKRKSSLYISPYKLTEVNETGYHGFNHRASQILKAGGVDNAGVLEDNRSDLLVAIRKGIQLKKVCAWAGHIQGCLWCRVACSWRKNCSTCPLPWSK